MLKARKTPILLSFLGLWLTSFMSDDYQMLLGFGLIFSFGILHGANDLVLINHLERDKRYNFVTILASYLTVITLSVILFTLLPTVALGLFIVVSAYHFGEQHWEELLNASDSFWKHSFLFIYGMCLLLLLFYFNSREVAEIIFKITSIPINEMAFTLTLFVLLSLLVLNAFYLVRKSALFKKNVGEQLFYLIILCIIFKVSSLIWGFAIYFIFWHSIPSINDQVKFLYGESSLKNFKTYFKSASLYWVVALMGIASLIAISRDLLIFDALFFSFLASITFPHAFVILKMYAKRKD